MCVPPLHPTQNPKKREYLVPFTVSHTTSNFPAFNEETRTQAWLVKAHDHCQASQELVGKMKVGTGNCRFIEVSCDDPSWETSIFFPFLLFLVSQNNYKSGFTFQFCIFNLVHPTWTKSCLRISPSRWSKPIWWKRNTTTNAPRLSGTQQMIQIIL